MNAIIPLLLLIGAAILFAVTPTTKCADVRSIYVGSMMVAGCK